MRLKNIKEELETYGYKFDLSKTMIWIVIGGTIVVAVGRTFGLPVIYMIALAAGLGFIAPFFITCVLKVQFEEKRFAEINIYMEQLLYSFQKSGKILSSLRDVQQLFESGNMHDAIGESISYMEHTYDSDDIAGDALGILEKKYPANLLYTIHKYCNQVEINGGESAMGINLLLEARRMWADRCMELMKMKRQKVLQIILSVGISIFMCWMLITVGKRMNIDICQYAITRVTMVVTLWIDVLIIYQGCKTLSKSLCETRMPGEEVLDKIAKLQRHSGKGGMHPFDGFIKRDIRKALEQVFPQWLLQVSLLLQGENVQVALAKSYEDAPVLMKPFLRKLLQSLRDNPGDMMAYVNFMQEYNLPQVQSTMKMLYSISEGNGGRASSQIEDIIRRNQIMYDQSEKMKNSDEMAGMYALFLAPQITAGMKMLVDMFVMFYGMISAGFVMGG
ncbi:MAG: hypothetical protein IJ655_04955 [Lachnospiraceae bacterium]|nr:hypothetical protein [Lachnospiraceae bacterium]